MKFLCSETQAIISTELAEKVIKISDFLSLGLRSTAFPLILYSKPVDRLEYRCLCKENIDKMKTFSLQEVELIISLSDHFPVCQVQKSKCIGPVSYFDVIFCFHLQIPLIHCLLLPQILQTVLHMRIINSTVLSKCLTNINNLEDRVEEQWENPKEKNKKQNKTH